MLKPKTKTYRYLYFLSHPEFPKNGLSLESVGTRSRRLQYWAPGLDSLIHQLTHSTVQSASAVSISLGSILISRGRRVRRPTTCHTMSGNFRFCCVTKAVHVTFSLNVLCFPFTIGKVKITVFHLLVAATFVFTYLWGYVIYNMLIKDNQVRGLNSEN